MVDETMKSLLHQAERAFDNAADNFGDVRVLAINDTESKLTPDEYIMLIEIEQEDLNRRLEMLKQYARTIKGVVGEDKREHAQQAVATI